MTWYTLRTDCLLLALLSLYCVRGMYLGKKYALKDRFMSNLLLRIPGYAILCAGTLLICGGLIAYLMQIQSTGDKLFPVSVLDAGTFIQPHVTSLSFYVFAILYVSVCTLLDFFVYNLTLDVPFKKAAGLAFFSNIRLYLFALLPIYIFMYGLRMLF